MNEERHPLRDFEARSNNATNPCSPEPMLRVGQNVRIVDAKTGLDGNFEVIGVDYEFDSEGEQLGTFSFGMKAVALVS